MKRRDLLILLAASSVSCWPVEAGAQRADRMRHIAMLMSYAEADSEAQKWVAAFRTALRELGWTEGHNVRIQIRWATGDPATIGRLAKEIVESRPDLILASTTPATAALLQQTHTIPIVFALVSDPVGSGFVASFPRPGGNVSGFTTMEPTMAEKWLELLKEAVPHVARLAFLFNPPSAPYIDVYLKPFLAAARSLAVEVIVPPVRSISDLEFAVNAQARASNGSLLIWPDAFMTAHRVEIASLLARHRLPAVSPFRVFAESGCLLSYGSDSVDNFRRAASYVDRILRGEKPAVLPVQQPTKFELVINLKTAKALGLTIPPSLLQRADQVIE